VGWGDEEALMNRFKRQNSTHDTASKQGGQKGCNGGGGVGWGAPGEEGGREGGLVSVAGPCSPQALLSSQMAHTLKNRL